MVINQKNIYDQHIELDHPSEVIAHATDRAIGPHLTGMFKLYKGCTLGKAKRAASLTRMLSTKKSWEKSCSLT